MQPLEVSGVVRLIYRSLGVKGLMNRLKVVVDIIIIIIIIIITSSIISLSFKG